MIVGHKINQYLTVERRDYGGHFDVTTHRVVTALHATKGWRKVGHTRHVQTVRNLPSIEVQREATFTRWIPTPRSKPAAVDWIDAVSPEVRERAVMRHKARRVERRRAENLARLSAG